MWYYAETTLRRFEGRMKSHRGGSVDFEEKKPAVGLFLSRGWQRCRRMKDRSRMWA
jgi:hypothetical protein